MRGYIYQIGFKLSFFLCFSLPLAACAEDPLEAKARKMIQERGLPADTPIVIVETGDSLRVYCAGRPTSLEHWVQHTPNIFIGEVVSRQVRMPPNKTYFHGCWVKMRVQESLKGSLPPEVWIKASYSARLKKDVTNIDNCFFKEKESYLVFAKAETKSDWLEAKSYFGTGTSDNDSYFCPPTQPTSTAQEMLATIRQLLKGK